jgi:hypothetical protein
MGPGLHAAGSCGMHGGKLACMQPAQGGLLAHQTVCKF